jgi:DNA-binding response OmpR family regulator
MRLAQTHVFDLITLDISMPNLSGFELHQRLRRIPHMGATPVIFVTGRASEEDRQHALNLGAVDYITKPFDTFDFVPRLLSHVRKAEEVSASD